MARFKIDLHTHTNDDPHDYISYSSFDLLDLAAAQGFHAIAITLHGKRLAREDAFEYAKSKGVLLIPGIEKFVNGKEVLIYNVSPEEVAGKMSFSDLGALRNRRSDVYTIAPHPFFPTQACAGRTIEKHPDLFDALEYSHAYTSYINFNSPAQGLAQRLNKPMVATSDAHILEGFGRNFTYVECDQLDTISIFEAIKAHRVELVHAPHSLKTLIPVLKSIFVQNGLRLAQRLSKTFAPSKKPHHD